MTHQQAQLWANFLRGQVVADYRLGDCLGGGNFSVVIEGTHVTTDATVAVKILLPAQQSGQDTLDFEQEGRLLKRLVKCSNVITLVFTGTEVVNVPSPGGPLPFTVNYHVLSAASGTLQELIQDPAVLTSLSIEERLAMWRGAVLGVHQMHLKSVAHRDLKPDNCLLVVSGNKTEIRLTDLGRGRDMQIPSRLLTDDYLVGRGDLNFAPPEFIYFQGRDRPIDCKNTDLYGLGSLLYEMVTGQPVTAAAIGPVRATMIMAQRQFAAGQVRDLATLRPAYAFAASDFEQGLPPIISHEATELVKQLTDPVPDARQPRRGLGRRAQPDTGLQWLLNRADILTHRMSTAHKKRTNRTSPSPQHRSA